MREKRKPMPNYCISISRDEDIVNNPQEFIIATLLCSYLARRDEVSNGEIPQARRKLCHEPWRYGMMLCRQDAERVMAGDSAFWHWEGERLVVDLFDTEAEAKFAKRCKVARNNIKSRWEKDKHDTTVNTAVDTTVNTTVHTDVYTKGGCNKERNDFLTENLSNAGGSAAAMPPALGEQEQRQQAALQLEEALALVHPPVEAAPAAAAPCPTAEAQAEAKDAPPCPAAAAPAHPTAPCPTAATAEQAPPPAASAAAPPQGTATPAAPPSAQPSTTPGTVPPSTAPSGSARPGKKPAPPPPATAAGKEVSHG